MNTLPYFIFNNLNSKDLGIVIKEMPPVSKAEKDIESIEVSGRNGSLHIDNETYRKKEYKVKCILMDESKIDDIKKLYNGIGVLELSTEPGKEYKASISNQIDFSKYLTYLKEFVLQFNLDPISYSKTIKEEKITSNSTFTIGGTYQVSPQIIITGTGIVTINNNKIEVNESGITIDCDLMNCTKENINKNDKVNLEDFPTLNPGSNSIVLGTGIQSVIIKYKEGWL